MAALAPLMLAALPGCETPAPESAAAPEYLGVETRLLDGDLVSFKVTMRNPQAPDDVIRYAECAAAGYTLIRGFGFARHVRTLTEDRQGIVAADAVYTISAALPRGSRTIDAEVVAAACRADGIPTV